ncbi:MAG TPA: methylated-DNA--[protein]-cysteine S-methyltransferase [Coxiellaceae bacterium]|nr:methylated-DNA--[protein]-cysteine S-methyltransferase [Coxiellaceae bacterium]
MMKIRANNSTIFFLPSPIGVLKISLDNHCLTSLEILEKGADSIQQENQAPFLQAFLAYFKNPHYRFTLSLALNVTSFQTRVLQALQTIPVGEVRTYGQLADQLNTSPRAIGNACRHNPIPIVIPCHRVIGAVSLGGYCGEIVGEKLSVKQWLLRHEGALA